MTCRICRAESDDVTPGMLRWKTGRDVKYGTAPRCRDRSACIRRVEEQGRDWPVMDAPPVLSSRLAGASSDAGAPTSADDSGDGSAAGSGNPSAPGGSQEHVEPSSYRSRPNEEAAIGSPKEGET